MSHSYEVHSADGSGYIDRVGVLWGVWWQGSLASTHARRADARVRIRQLKAQLRAAAPFKPAYQLEPLFEPPCLNGIMMRAWHVEIGGHRDRRQRWYFVDRCRVAIVRGKRT